MKKIFITLGFLSVVAICVYFTVVSYRQPQPVGADGPATILEYRTSADTVWANAPAGNTGTATTSLLYLASGGPSKALALYTEDADQVDFNIGWTGSSTAANLLFQLQASPDSITWFNIIPDATQIATTTIFSPSGLTSVFPAGQNSLAVGGVATSTYHVSARNLATRYLRASTTASGAGGALFIQAALKRNFTR